MSDQQQKMTIDEFVTFIQHCAEEEGLHKLCEEGIRRAAEQLVERGVLAEEPGEKQQRVEVEGWSIGPERGNPGSGQVEIEDKDGDFLDWTTPERIPALARALALWCGEEQASPEPAQGTRERPYIWRRRTEDGGIERVGVWLTEETDGDVTLVVSHDDLDTTDEFGAGCRFVSFDSDKALPDLWPIYSPHYPAPRDAASRPLFEHQAQPTPPPEWEVVLRLSREEAQAIAVLCSNVCPTGSTLANAAGEVSEKLEAYLPEDVEDSANDLGIAFQD